MKLLKLALLVIAIMAVTLGSTFYFLKTSGILNGGQPSEAAPVVEKPAPPAKPIFLKLDPFTVTLRDNNTTRILYVEITLRVDDDKSREYLTEYMPEVRNRVISELSRKTPAYLQTNEGREELSANIVKSLTEPYQPNPERPRISNVLFTAFVIQ